MKEKVLLLILDGFGLSDPGIGNAIENASTPNYDTYKKDFAGCNLESSGLSVGLPEDTMGNSEVGHLNIGAGRIVFQMNTFIDSEIAKGSFYENPSLKKAIAHVRIHSSKLHLFGLMSDGNVHSYHKHLWALLEFCRQQELKEVYFHAFMDGRDTSPKGGYGYLEKFLKVAKKIGIGRIATISGRYYAMDRDQRWERIRKAYEAIIKGKGEIYRDPLEAIKDSYDQGITDEFILPKVITDAEHEPVTIKDGDCIIFFNFRADRARQITRAFIKKDFNKFPVKKFKDLKFICFAEYDSDFKDEVEICFRLPKMVNILGEVISKNNLKQLRLAETEKYAHVTFFFNGGREDPFPGEDRLLVPSPKVATYDLQPEMSAFLVRDLLIENLKMNKYDLIITNFANCDMIGHTGVYTATLKAVEVIDQCLGNIVPVAIENGYSIIITADHGNAEKMLDEKGNPFTAHTKNKVPFLLHLNDQGKPLLKNGILADIAPTILKMMSINKPIEMTGNSLLQEGK